MFYDGRGRKIHSFKTLVTKLNNTLHRYNVNEVVVGCDSQIISYYAHFVIAIVVRDPGHGGTFFIQTFRITNENKKFTLVIKLQKEVQVILDVIDKLKKYGLKESVIIIPHVDIGYNGDSRKYVKSLVGWIKGVGYDPIIKPDCYVANGLCNKFSKKFQRRYKKN